MCHDILSYKKQYVNMLSPTASTENHFLTNASLRFFTIHLVLYDPTTR